MRPHEAFFLVEDSLDEKLDELYHIDYSESLEHFDLGGLFKSKSKYKGGFKKGKNTKEYNHDYYIHNKDKWKKDKESEETTEMTVDELEELGLTDEQIEELQLEKNSEGVLIVPTEWINNFLKGGLGLIGLFVDSLKDLLLPKKPDISINPDQEEEPDSLLDNLLPQKKTDGYEDPKTLDDPQRISEYEIETEDPSGRETEKITTNFEVIDWLKGAKVKKEPASIKEDCAAVNPNYKTGEPEYAVNCAWCTTAYDLRRRGYDVQAPGVKDGLTVTDETQFYKDTTIEDWAISSSAENLFSALEKEGNGARGRISVSWRGGGGHSMAWEVVDNKAYVIDCQTNNTYSYEEFVAEMGRSISWNEKSDRPEIGKSYDVVSAGCVWLRTDNREINTSGILHEDVDHAIEWKLDTDDLVYNNKKTYVMTPGDYNDVNLSEMFVSYPVDEYSKEQWDYVSSKLKNRRVRSRSKKNKERPK